MKLREIKVQYSRKHIKDMSKISSSKMSDTYIREVYAKSKDIDIKESFYVVCLNRGNRVLGHYLLSVGGTSETVVDLKILFSVLVKTLSSAFILVHNHPSGRKEPSPLDRDLTQKVKKASKVLDIQLLDHIILTSESYFSFADEDLL